MSQAKVAAPPATADAPAESVAEAAPPDVHASAWWWIRAAAVLVTIYLAIQILNVARSVVGATLTVFLYLLFGAVLAFVLGPIVQLLEDRAHLPRTAGIVLTLASTLGLLVGVGFLIAGPIVSEASALTRQAPTIIKQVNDFLDTLRSQLAAHGINLSGNPVSGTISSDITSRVAGAALNIVQSVLAIGLDLLVTLVVAFWLLKDGEQLRAGVVRLLPGRLRSEADFAFDAVGVVVGGYVRAQLLMALIIGVMAFAGCLAIGVPYPIVVALAAGAFELIPLVGAFVGGAVAILLALTRSPTTALLALGLFIVIHIIEGYLLAPRIQARFVRLHPLITILALFAGIDAGGFLGALVAVPLASLVAVFIRAALGDARSRHPELFREQRRERQVERRRKRILGEFRLIRRPPSETGVKTDIDTVP